MYGELEGAANGSAKTSERIWIRKRNGNRRDPSPIAESLEAMNRRPLFILHVEHGDQFRDLQQIVHPPGKVQEF